MLQSHWTGSLLVSPADSTPGKLEACLAIVFADAPFGADLFPVLKALQSKVKRTMIDKEDLFRLA